MSPIRNSWVRAARWVMAILAAFVVIAQPVVATTARSPVAKPGACCNKCKCCVSDPDSTSRPVAPAPARTTIAKSYELASVLHAALLPAPIFSKPASFAFSHNHFSATVPAFIRHCTFLI